MEIEVLSAELDEFVAPGYRYRGPADYWNARRAWLEARELVNQLVPDRASRRLRRSQDLRIATWALEDAIGQCTVDTDAVEFSMVGWQWCAGERVAAAKTAVDATLASLLAAVAKVREVVTKILGPEKPARNTTPDRPPGDLLRAQPLVAHAPPRRPAAPHHRALSGMAAA